MKKVWKKRIMTLVLMGTVLCSLVACGSYSDSASYEKYTINEMGYDGGWTTNDMACAESYDMVTEESFVTGDSAGGDVSKGPDVTTNRKLIRTVSLDVETEEFEVMIVNVEDRVNAMGGYIEQAYTYNGSAFYNSSKRYAEMTVRVPDAKLEGFVDEVSGFSNVVSKTTTTQDITLEYVDTEGLRDMYLAEETSLLALLEKAETVEDITYLTTRLSEVRYNIENLESRLLKYDDLVEYATIHLYIEEVEVYTPVVTEEKTFGEEIKDGFAASMQDIWNSIVNFVKNLIINLPYIVRFIVNIGLIILAIRLIIVIIKKVIKNKKAKKAAKKNGAVSMKEVPVQTVETKETVQTSAGEKADETVDEVKENKQ